MRALETLTQASLTARNVARRDFLTFALGSGTYGFWSGFRSITISGQVYVGAGNLIAISLPAQSADGRASPMTVTLRAVPDSDLTPSILATIESEQYHRRPVEFLRGYFDVDTRALLSMTRMFRGYISNIEHRIASDRDATLSIAVESRLLDLSKIGHRVFGDADQRSLYPNDGAFKMVATAGEVEVFWGTNPPKRAREGASGDRPVGRRR